MGLEELDKLLLDLDNEIEQLISRLDKIQIFAHELRAELAQSYLIKRKEELEHGRSTVNDRPQG